MVVHRASGSEPVGSGFLIPDVPPQDAQATTVPPCDGIAVAIAGVSQVSPQPVRSGHILRLSGRSIDRSTHITFTVAPHEVDPHARGLDPDLIDIDFGASARPRSAPRWLDMLATNIGRSYGATASLPGLCDSGNTAGHAAIRKTDDREGEVCVPALALSGPIGLWRAAGSTGDTCEPPISRCRSVEARRDGRRL